MARKVPNRVTAVIDDDTLKQVQYWADKKEMSINEFVRYAIDLTIKRCNGDYDLPTLEQARLNQLVDEIKILSFNAANLEHIVTSGFDNLLRLTRGENYLMDDTSE